MTDAQTALVTGDIETPSQCSQWSSGGSAEEGSLQGKSSPCSSTTSSSGEEFIVRDSETESYEVSEDSDRNEVSNSVGYTLRSSEEEEFRSSTETTSSEDYWVADDTSSSRDSTSEFSEEVCFSKSRMSPSEKVVT